jgi:hypothetical protein
MEHQLLLLDMEWEHLRHTRPACRGITTRCRRLILTALKFLQWAHQEAIRLRQPICLLNNTADMFLPPQPLPGLQAMSSGFRSGASNHHQLTDLTTFPNSSRANDLLRAVRGNLSIIENTRKRVQSVDIAFLIDCTGSMQHWSKYSERKE